MRWLESWSLGSVLWALPGLLNKWVLTDCFHSRWTFSLSLCVEVCVCWGCVYVHGQCMLEDLCFLADWKLTTRKAFSIASRKHGRYRAAQPSPQSCCTQLSWVLSTEDDSAVSTPMERPLLFCYNWYVIELPTLPGDYL